MEKAEVAVKVKHATKWSAITEISTKLILPITNMVLARLLTPDAFGVVAVVSMVVSFSDMLTDAGFNKYLVQHEFVDEKEKNKFTSVSFWTNMAVSVFLWILIVIFNAQIANMVGNPGLGIVIIISAIQLPITTFSSIQAALFKRDFRFKPLFIARIVSTMIPFFITIPLALLGLSYWSLVIGTLASQIAMSIILTVGSKWKPNFFFSFPYLKKMLSFSIWTLFESISIWLTAWIDTFIIGFYLSDYYLGIYKTSLNMVNSLLAVITAVFVPVLFSALSRLQNDEKSFKSAFYITQKIVAYCLLPIGVGLFLYSDTATRIMLGSQWNEASAIIGIWALTSALRIVFFSLYSEVYRAKGRPRLSLLAQVIHLVILIPACIISIKIGFWALVYTRALIKLEGIVTGLIFMSFFMKFKPFDILKNVFKPILCVVIMIACSYALKSISNTTTWDLVSIAICVIIYFSSILLFGKKDIKTFLRLVKKKK